MDYFNFNWFWELSKIKQHNTYFQVLCLSNDCVIYYRSLGKNGSKGSSMNLTYVYCENVTRLAPVEIYEWINILLIEKSFSIVLLNLLNLRIAGQTYLDSHKQPCLFAWPFPAQLLLLAVNTLIKQSLPASFSQVCGDLLCWAISGYDLWLKQASDFSTKRKYRPFNS